MVRRNFHFVCLAGLVAVILIAVAPAHADVTTFVATDVTYIDSILADTNFGGQATFQAGRKALGGNTFDERFGYTLFDISSLPAGAQVTGATLRLFLDGIDDITGREAMTLYATTPQWTQGALTWNNQPTGWDKNSRVRANKFYEDFAGSQTNVWTEIDILTYGKANFWVPFLESASLVSINQTMDGDIPMAFADDSPFIGAQDGGYWDFTASGTRPELVISYDVPEPTSAMLFVLAGI
jgi:hypothetical protein